MRTREQKEELFKSGVCTLCAVKSSVPGSRSCQDCRNRRNANHRNQRIKNIAKGLCSECGVKHSRYGKPTCPECYRKINAAGSRLRSRRSSSGLCLKCGKKRDGKSKIHCESCREWHANHSLKKNREIRAEVLAKYGGKCACCGEAEPLFLQLDHILGDGHSERRMVLSGKSNNPYTFYRYVKRRGFPKDRYQLLCANCNWGKAVNGGTCPHKSKSLQL